jgi:hypothetical protein
MTEYAAVFFKWEVKRKKEELGSRPLLMWDLVFDALASAALG